MLKGLKERGLEQVHLLISDRHVGIRNACLDAFPEAKHQSC